MLGIGVGIGVNKGNGIGVSIPANTVAPVISGTQVVGQTLSCTTGTWTGTPTYAYQWKLNGSNIGGATSSTYVLQQTDAGSTNTIICVVTATNSAGSVSANSNTLTGITDADAQAFFDATGVTDSTQKAAVNTLTIGLKSNSLWTSCYAIYPMVGGTATTHKFNLKDPRDLDAAFRLSFAGGWTHSSNGALPNGTTGYANTFLTPLTSMNKDDSHYSYYSRTNVNAAQTELGVILSSIENGLSLYTNNLYPNFKGAAGSYVSVAVADTIGCWLANRKSTTNSQGWRNGTKLLDTAQTSGVANGSVYLAADHNNISQTQYSTKQCAFASMGLGFSDANALIFSNLIIDFQTTLGRNV